jgi:hypothetical protein
LSSGFLLVETVPGREGQVLELLSRIPGVTHRHVLFPAAIAVKLELPREAIDPTVTALTKLDGVLRTNLYRAKNN